MKKKKYLSLEYEIQEYLYDVISTSASSWDDSGFEEEGDNFWS